MAFELGEVLIAAEEIERRVETLAAKIDCDYPAGRLHLVVALKSACFFASDLARAVRRDLSLEFLQASSYGSGAESSGRVAISSDHELDIGGARVLLVEDIVDSGRTANALIAHLAQRGAESVRMAALLSKPDRRVIDVRIDYLGFEIPDRFVVGYGMDYDGCYRNLPDIRFLRAIDRFDNGICSGARECKETPEAVPQGTASGSAGGIIPPSYPPPACGPRR